MSANPNPNRVFNIIIYFGPSPRNINQRRQRRRTVHGINRRNTTFVNLVNLPRQITNNLLIDQLFNG
ncbi:19898_t:CDS:1, partial [Funneliformis geosporum]